MSARKTTKIDWFMVALGTIPMLITLGTGLWTIGSWFGSFQTQVKAQFDNLLIQVDGKIAPVAAKVDAVSTKVDATNALTQAKQDALSSKVDSNVAEQVQFRATVQNAFTKVFDGQQKATDALNQERVDRLTEQGKKK
jgi:hypothetical protein